MRFFRVLSLFLALVGMLIFVLVGGFIYTFVTKGHDPQWIINVILWTFIGAAALTGSLISFLEGGR